MFSSIDLFYLFVTMISPLEMKNLILSNLEFSKHPKIVFTPNAGHLSSLIKDKELNNVYRQSDFNLIDGWPIAIAAKIKSRKNILRVTGSDLIPELFKDISRDVRVGIFGGKDEQKIRKILEQKYNNLNLQIVNCENWTESTYDLRRIRELIQFNALSIVILALGHPKQEKIAFELKKFDWVGARPNWILCVGASIDFLVGDQKRAPILFRKLGFEWLYRLFLNPKKLFKRYLLAIIPSIKLIFKSII